MLFILKVTAMDSLTKKNVYPHFYSHPIRVVSRPPRLLKRKAAEAGLQDPSTPQPFKKKNFQQNLQEVLGRIDEQHEHQKLLIQQIMLRTDRLKALAIPKELNCGSSSIELKSKEHEQTPSSPACDPLQKSFQQLLQAYQALSQDEKPKRIRAVLRKTSQRDTEKLAELVESFYKENLTDSVAKTRLADFPVYECVHKKELDNLNSFFDLFQTTAVDA